MREIIIAMMHNPPVTVHQLQGTKRSYTNKLNIVNHFCMVIIIGQIEPKGSLKTTTLFIRRTE